MALEEGLGEQELGVGTVPRRPDHQVLDILHESAGEQRVGDGLRTGQALMLS